MKETLVKVAFANSKLISMRFSVLEHTHGMIYSPGGNMWTMNFDAETGELLKSTDFFEMSGDFVDTFLDNPLGHSIIAYDISGDSDALFSSHFYSYFDY